MRLLERMICVIAASFAIGSQALAEDCKTVIPGLDSYERQVKQAIRDEPEDLPKELQRYARALDSEDPAQADRVQRKIRSGFVGLKMIDPPPDLSRLHLEMIDYYGAAVAVLDAWDVGDVPARRAAELETWMGLKRFFSNLRTLFAEHRCNEGDVEALDEHYLPEIDTHLDRIRSGEALPDTY